MRSRSNIWATARLVLLLSMAVQSSVINAFAQEISSNQYPVYKPGYTAEDRKRADAAGAPRDGSVAPPTNDNFANAQVINSSPFSFLTTNAEATAEAGEPYHGAGGGASTPQQNNSIWFKHTAVTAQVMTVWTANTSPPGLIDTVISAYTGSTLNSLIPVAECDDFPGRGFHSQISFATVPGQTYYIAVDGYLAMTGGFSLTFFPNPWALNNDFADAVDLTAAGLESPVIGITGSNAGSTSEAGEPQHDTSGGPTNSIWYKWTPEQSETVTFRTAGSNFDTTLAVYTGSTVNALTLVGRNDDFGPSVTSQVTFFAIGGVTYRIAVDGFATNTGNSLLNWAPYFDEAGKRYDFDGDKKTDISIFRPSNGQWWIKRSLNNAVIAGTFGSAVDRPTPGDFTGDGKVDLAFWRPSNGSWFILRSEDSSYYSVPFGTSSDVPFVGQFDNDAKADYGVFRPSTATWYISRSRSGQPLIVQFGLSGDVPVVADYDGDGVSDIAIYRPSNGQWWINRSRTGLIAVTFGAANDKPVVGDYTGDGRADVASWRPSTGEWFILRSEDSSYYAIPFGISSDLPAPGDYDGDARTDQAVFRSSNGTWYLNQSGMGVAIRQFGIAGDRPTPNSFIP